MDENEELNHDANNQMKNGYLIIFVAKNLWSKCACRLRARHGPMPNARSHPCIEWPKRRTHLPMIKRVWRCPPFRSDTHKSTSMMNAREVRSYIRNSNKVASFSVRQKCKRTKSNDEWPMPNTSKGTLMEWNTANEEEEGERAHQSTNDDERKNKLFFGFDHFDCFNLLFAFKYMLAARATRAESWFSHPYHTVH